jgi:PIN domain nuclease of toxin-antitoxin system
VTNQKRRLGVRVQKVFAAADQGQALISLSVITLLELDWLEAARKLQFKEGFEGLVQRLLASPGYQIVPLTMEMILLSRRFRDSDPMDRLIVATAEELDCSLITADAAIRARHPVPTVWD